MLGITKIKLNFNGKKIRLKFKIASLSLCLACCARYRCGITLLIIKFQLNRIIITVIPKANTPAGRQVIIMVKNLGFEARLLKFKSWLQFILSYLDQLLNLKPRCFYM